MAIVSLHIPPSSCFFQHHHNRTLTSVRCCSVKSSSASVTRTSSINNGTGVIWYKNDLRVDDHQGLVAAASQQHKTLVPIYVFDHRILRNFTQEMLELLLFALEDLRNSLKDLGSDLMIRFGRTESVIQDLVKEVSATNIYTQEEVEYDLRLVVENVKETLLGENSPEIFLWSTPLYDTKNMVDLPLSYDDFQRLNFNVHSPLSAPKLPGSPIDLAWGPLPTLDDLKEFMDESPYKLTGTWSSIKSSSAEKVLQNARNLISNGVTNSQSNMNSLTTQVKEKRVKNSAFVTKLGIFVGGGTSNVLNALAAYLRYLEGTARDDWQEVHARLRDAETREGASFGFLFDT